MMRAFAWAGGALFVASLAFTGITYGVSFGDAAPWNGWTAVAYDAALFSAFALHHSLFARLSIKDRLASIVPEPALRSLYVWVASLLLIAVCVAWRTIGGQAYDTVGAWGRGAHAIAQLAGVLLIARSVRSIDALELAGIHRSRMNGTLTVSGPYGIVRHPVYLGWMLVVFGAARMTGDRLVFAAVSSLYLVVAIPWEERALAREFGAAYARYKEAVRWRVMPYLY
jgi:protein-S-isoprenylcysteine O-methyltransferase Ste14